MVLLSAFFYVVPYLVVVELKGSGLLQPLAINIHIGCSLTSFSYKASYSVSKVTVCRAPSAVPLLPAERFPQPKRP